MPAENRALTPCMQVFPPNGGINCVLSALAPLEEEEWYRQMAALYLAVAWCKVVATKTKKAKVLEQDLRSLFEFSVQQIPTDQWPHGVKTVATIERLLAVYKRKSKGGVMAYIDLVEKVKRDREFIRDIMNPWFTKTYPHGLKSGTNYGDFLRRFSEDMSKLDVKMREEQAKKRQEAAARKKQKQAQEGPTPESQRAESGRAKPAGRPQKIPTAVDEMPPGWMHPFTVLYLCVVRAVMAPHAHSAPFEPAGVLVCRAALLATDYKAVVPLPPCKASINTLKTSWT